MTDRRNSALDWLLRGVAAVGLAVGAYVHWDLAPTYDPVRAATAPHLTQGGLFRLQAVVLLAAALLLLLVRARWTALLAAAVALGSVAAVLLYRYVEIDAIGPLPGMYEPSWYAEKTVSAIAEGVAAVAALAAAFLPGRRTGRAVDGSKRVRPVAA